MEILPIGEPMLETFSLYPLGVSRTRGQLAVIEVENVGPHALRAST